MAEITKKAVLDIDASKAAVSIKDLRQALKEAKDNMANLEEGSDAFLEAANKAGELKHLLDAINLATRAASKDFGDLMSNAAKVGAGMIGSFLAVKGAMTLLGAESENVEKAILKMLASMAVIQGLQSIDQGVKSFKTLKTAISAATSSMNGFKKALIASGLGALVVVLGSIIANWDEFTESIGLSSDELLKLQDVWNGVMGVLQGSLRGLTRAIMKITTGDFKGAWEAVKEGFNITANYTNGVAKGIEKRVKEASKNIVSTVQTTVAEVNEEIGKVWGVKDEESQMRFNYLFNVQELKEQLELGLIDIEYFNERKAELDAAYYEDYQSLQLSIFENEELEYSERLTAYQNFLKSKEEQTKASNQTIVEDTKTTNTSIQKSDEQVNAKKVQVALAAANAIGTVMSALTSNMDEQNEEQFEKNKKMQIGMATINMLTGIAAAIAGLFTTKSGPWDIALAAIQATSIGIASAANIAKIAQTKYEGGSSPSASVPAISPAALSSAQSPVQYTQDVQGASIEGTIKDQRVYVTETDITDVQKKVDITETESVF